MTEPRTFSARRIPGLWPGIFFFLLAGSAGAGVSLSLAGDLYAEGQWTAARTEARRAQAEAGDVAAAAAARLLGACSALRLGEGREAAKTELATVWNHAGAAPAARCEAAYELGLAEWADRRMDSAFPALEYAFLRSRDVPLFLRSGCSLYFFLKADRPRRRANPALWQALQSCRDIWPPAVWRECRPRRKAGPSWASAPGRWIVTFYRAQIGPAIGSRCDLQPSCSEYFLQASRAHGLLGIPIMADRFIREPSVVSAAETPVTMPDGRIRYADPVSDHDFWMKRKK